MSCKVPLEGVRDMRNDRACNATLTQVMSAKAITTTQYLSGGLYVHYYHWQAVLIFLIFILGEGDGGKSMEMWR